MVKKIEVNNQYIFYIEKKNYGIFYNNLNVINFNHFLSITVNNYSFFFLNFLNVKTSVLIIYF